MKTTVLNSIRKKGTIALLVFVFLFALDTYAQWGGNRRVARRTARRTTRRNVGYGGAGSIATPPPGAQPYFHGTNVVY